MHHSIICISDSRLDFPLNVITPPSSTLSLYPSLCMLFHFPLSMSYFFFLSFHPFYFITHQTIFPLSCLNLSFLGKTPKKFSSFFNPPPLFSPFPPLPSPHFLVVFLTHHSLPSFHHPLLSLLLYSSFSPPLFYSLFFDIQPFDGSFL